MRRCISSTSTCPASPSTKFASGGAFAHAIDRQALAKIPFFGFARVATGPVPASQKAFYKSNTPQYPVDLKKAQDLLDAAGLKPGSDGTRLKINHLVLPYGDDYIRAASFIQQQLKRVGVQLTLENLDLSTYLRRIFTDRDFDTMSAYYAAFSDPQVGVIRRSGRRRYIRELPGAMPAVTGPRRWTRSSRASTPNRTPRSEPHSSASCRLSRKPTCPPCRCSS
jgi:ABC-type transport system substrate-binding protein